MVDVAKAPPRTLAHPWIVAGIAFVVLVGAWIVANQRPLPTWELDVTEWINDAPGWAADALWPVMQLGMLIVALVVAIVIGIVRRDWFLAVAMIVATVATWVLTKGVKDIVDRRRPAVYIPDVNVREGSGSELGFFSGHAALAATTIVMAMAAVPPRWRPVLVAVAFLVGLGRVVHGVHLAVDVVGGWAFGTLVGVAGLTVVDRYRAQHPRQ
jgi:glycosyltransferase 2 family protein